MAVDWGYFDRFDKVMDKYLPPRGEGETKASQIVTAVSKLVYKWYNDGDVFDNTGYMSGWLCVNDLSSYANWLFQNTDAGSILEGIYDCYGEDDYEELLKELADALLDMEDLEKAEKEPKTGSIYNCKGMFRYEEYEEEEEDWEEEEW